MDANRHANKALNLDDHIAFGGAVHPDNDDELDRLVKLQKKMTYNELILQQMREREAAKQAKLREAQEAEEKDRIRIERDNILLQKRKEEEDRLLKMKQSQRNL